MGAGLEHPDERLVLLAKDGNLEAFNSLVDRYQGAVYSLCARILGNREAAEDAAQEAFINAFRSLRRFEGGNFRSWLLRIAANESKDELRRRKRRGAASLEEIFDNTGAPVELPDHGETAESLIERAELGATLSRALLALPFEQRQAVVLVDVYGFQYEEVAEVARASVGTIKSRIHRGREKLRMLLGPTGELSAAAGRQIERGVQS